MCRICFCPGKIVKRALTRIIPAFAAVWIVYSIHWYLVSEFSKFARFSFTSSTTYAAIFTVGGLLLGLMLKWQPLGSIWVRAGRWTLLISLLGIGLLAWDYCILWPREIPSRSSDLARLFGYLLSGFPLLHLPEEKTPKGD